MEAVRYTVRFTGRVQGVGFRATTRSIARTHPVTGWVRNEPDGTVACVAEGTQPALEAFLAAVRSRMSGLISDVSVSTSTATGAFTGFEITRAGCSA